MDVAVVTGGSRGIGAAIVEQFARDGFAVACAATTAERAAQFAGTVTTRYGCPCLPVGMRVESPSSVAAAVEKIHKELGPPTILVNNAGMTNVAPLLQADLSVLSDVIDVNVKGVLNCTQAIASVMVASGTEGSIVNIGSVGGFNGFPGRSAYGASKAAVHHLTKILAVEFAEYGIRVNCVAPGFVETDMVKNLAASGVLDVEALKRRTPQHELIPADEVAATVRWLTSPSARHITGESVLVDGGWSAYGHL